MNRINGYRSLSLGLGLRSRIVILALCALTFHARNLLGQGEKGYESLLISDTSIPDLLALAKTDAVKENSIKLLLKIKKDSLEGRLMQAELNMKQLKVRKNVAANTRDHHRKLIDAIVQQTQDKSTVVPSSRAAAEQLLIAAQLELQRVSWDLAGEVVLLESTEKLRNAESKTGVFERQLAKLESKSIEEDLQSAEKDLQRVELLDKRGAMSADEVAKFRLSFSKAKNSLAMHQLRSQLAEAKDIALKDAQSVEAETQIRRLTARKGQIEEYIRELFTAMKDLTRREELLKSVDLKEQYLATLLNLEVDLETKTDEIEGLLQFLNPEKDNEDNKK